MLLLMDLRDHQLLPERPKTYSWSTEERFVKIHNVALAFLFENCHSPQCDATTMIAAPAHLLKVDRMIDLVQSRLQVAKARGQLDLLLERLDAITARGAPLLRPPPQAVGGEAPTSPCGSNHSRSAEVDQQNSDAIDTEQAFQEHLESLAEPLPSGLWADEYPNIAEQADSSK